MNWTKEENKEFERLLIEFPVESPMRYERIANCLPNKSADQVRMHYDKLVFDVHAIENGRVDHMLDYYHDDGVFSTDNENNNNNNKSEHVGNIQKNKRNLKCKWTEDEHRLFLMGLGNLGKGDWRGISRQYVKTKTSTQVASHAQKFFNRQNEQGMKKRKSIHDIIIDPSQMQQLNTMENLNFAASELQQQQQHVDDAGGQQHQVKQQGDQEVTSYAQHSDDLLEYNWLDTDHVLWKIQHKEYLDELSNNVSTPQEEHMLIHHDPERTSIEVNQSQSGQEEQLRLQQNTIMDVDDQLKFTTPSTVNQVQGLQKIEDLLFDDGKDMSTWTGCYPFRNN